MLDAKLKASVAEICERLDRAARIARAAQTRVEASNIKKAIEACHPATYLRAQHSAKGGDPKESNLPALMHIASTDLDATVETELDRLRFVPIAELRALWRLKFKCQPPKAFGPDLLRRSIAYKIQENAYGGLDATTARLLNQLIAQQAKIPGKIVLPRRIKPGVILVREWKGQSHRVTVMQDGFAYDGQTYDSLSKVARLITGARWNGPRFFGLRSDKE